MAKRFWTEPRALTAIIIFASILRLALAFRSEQLIYSKYYQEDAYYLFTVAEHVAHGEGFSADGIHPTNGVQPLIVIFYAPLFLLSNFNKLLALKLGFIYTALFDGLSMIFLYLLLKTLRKKNEPENSVWLRPHIIAPLLYGILFSVFVHTVSGLETGLHSMLLLAAVYQYAIIQKKKETQAIIPPLRYVILGLTLGLTILARIDTVLFVGMIALYELITHRIRGVKKAVIITGIAAVVSLPWWYYNYVTFGNIMPQSGISEQLGIIFSRNIWQTISTVADCMSIFFSLTKMVEIPWIYSLLWSIGIIGGIFLVTKKMKLADYIKRKYSLQALIPLFAAAFFLAVYYTFFFGAPHFIPRYLQPFRIGMIILGAMVIPPIMRTMLQSKVKKIILFLFLLAAIGNTFLRYPPNFLIKDYSTFYQVGKWALTQPQSKVGMYQSGASGFIASNVVNLDGKVNYEALKARLNGGIGSYIAKEHLDYLADQKPLALELVQSANTFGVSYELVDSIKEVMIYKRIR